MSDIAVGVIGTGGMGARHALNLHAHIVGATVSAVYDLDPSHAQHASDAAGNPHIFDNPIALINDPSVDAVVIASPDPTHADMAAECVRAGKPVLCEKPLATTADRALELVEQEVATGRRLVSLGFMRRFDPAHLAVKRGIEAGKIGRPMLFKGASRAAMMPGDLPVSTIMTNSAIHDLDSARWMMSRDPVEIAVRALRTHDHFPADARDLFLITMLMEGSCLVDIEVAMAAEYGYDIEATVVGEKGVLETRQPDVALLRSAGVRGYGYPVDWLERFQAAYVAELEEWVASLRANRTFCGASAWDGYVAVLIAQTCTTAAHSGGLTQIKVPQRPALYA